MPVSGAVTLPHPERTDAVRCRTPQQCGPIRIGGNQDQKTHDVESGDKAKRARRRPQSRSELQLQLTESRRIERRAAVCTYLGSCRDRLTAARTIDGADWYVAVNIRHRTVSFSLAKPAHRRTIPILVHSIAIGETEDVAEKVSVLAGNAGDNVRVVDDVHSGVPVSGA